MILQPKRWHKAEDPRYDSIRHHPWFNRLQKRKHVIPLMEGCFAQWSEDTIHSQEQICELWGVDSRDFRDYVFFVSGDSSAVDKTYQHILNNAYRAYCEHEAIRPIQSFIKDFAPIYGVKFRHVVEAWETNPTFYPDDYKYAIPPRY